MGRTVDGFSSFYGAAKIICRIVGRFGTAGIAARGTPELAAAATALVVACHAFKALDDYPGEIDSSGSIRTGEDVPPSIPE